LWGFFPDKFACFFVSGLYLWLPHFASICGINKASPKKEAIAWVDYTALTIMGELSGIFPFMCRRCRLLLTFEDSGHALTMVVG
jgi:hypothetical protein